MVINLLKFSMITGRVPRFNLIERWFQVDSAGVSEEYSDNLLQNVKCSQSFKRDNEVNFSQQAFLSTEYYYVLCATYKYKNKNSTPKIFAKSKQKHFIAYSKYRRYEHRQRRVVSILIDTRLIATPTTYSNHFASWCIRHRPSFQFAGRNFYHFVFKRSPYLFVYHKMSSALKHAKINNAKRYINTPCE